MLEINSIGFRLSITVVVSGILIAYLSRFNLHNKMNERYELLYEGKADGVIPVYKYKSKESGLTVAVCQVEGPLVNGYFCLGKSV